MFCKSKLCCCRSEEKRLIGIKLLFCSQLIIIKVTWENYKRIKSRIWCEDSTSQSNYPIHALHKIEKMGENKNKKEHRKCAKNECESYSAVIQKLRVSEKHANRDSHLVNINWTTNYYNSSPYLWRQLCTWISCKTLYVLQRENE